MDRTVSGRYFSVRLFCDIPSDIMCPPTETKQSKGGRAYEEDEHYPQNEGWY